MLSKRVLYGAVQEARLTKLLGGTVIEIQKFSYDFPGYYGLRLFNYTVFAGKSCGCPAEGGL
ncbi:hypothetical protein D3C75_1242760 [compost metagenome]